FDEKTNAAELLRALSGLGGDYRVRLGMGNPEHFALFFDELLDAMAHENVYRFLHIPVQSGSDAVLAHMKRPYDAAAFADLARRFRKRFPDGLLATDIIVGYPVETGADFQATLDLLALTRLDFVNVSKFSPRPGTLAAQLSLLDNQTVKRRSEACSALCRQIASENNQRFVGRELDVLAIEPAERSGVLCRSDDYRPAVLENAQVGRRYRCRVTAAGAGHLRAEAVAVEIPISFRMSARPPVLGVL
ncbi:MAG: radical SAM protein, partial [Candidatus Micrarchaeota archaeon]|nr:radical SAM protein [Candidatus Micrarchaeota archaeon]